MAKKKGVEAVNHAFAVGIIYHASNPQQIFLGVEDDEYPWPEARGKGTLIGGNWTGRDARQDLFPIDTFKREILEELSFEKANVDPLEFRRFFGTDEINVRKPRPQITPDQDDVDLLSVVRQEIVAQALPYSAYVVTLPRSFFPKNRKYDDVGTRKRVGWCFAVGLPDSHWNILTRLQYKFGNFSNESVTVITSLDEMVAAGFRVARGHDQALRQFFLDKGFSEARKMSMIPGVRTRRLGVPENSYAKYLERFRFKVTPFTNSVIPRQVIRQ